MVGDDDGFIKCSACGLQCSHEYSLEEKCCKLCGCSCEDGEHCYEKHQICVFCGLYSRFDPNPKDVFGKRLLSRPCEDIVKRVRLDVDKFVKEYSDDKSDFLMSRAHDCFVSKSARIKGAFMLNYKVYGQADDRTLIADLECAWENFASEYKGYYMLSAHRIIDSISNAHK